MGEAGKEIVAAGGVVSRETPQGREYLLVHRRRYDDWTLPKGKLKAGESLEQAAVREVEEETGYAVKLGEYLGEMRYEVRGAPKVVHLWRMEPMGPAGKVSDPEEVQSVSWLPAGEALRRLTHPLECEALAKAAQSGEPEVHTSVDPAG